MRSLPEVLEELQELGDELARTQQPLTDAIEEYILAKGRADAAIHAFIRDYRGAVGTAKDVASAENAELVQASVDALARAEGGKMWLKIQLARLEELRSTKSGLTAEMEVIKTGYGT